MTHRNFGLTAPARSAGNYGGAALSTGEKWLGRAARVFRFIGETVAFALLLAVIFIGCAVFE